MLQCIVGDDPLSRTYSYILSHKVKTIEGRIGPRGDGYVRTLTNLPNPVADVDADMRADRRVLLRGRLRVTNLLAGGNRFR
jgi:hypothetical protein